MKILNGITYIVTVFNKGNFVKNTLLSVLPFIKKNQILIIDDGSTDNSLSIINDTLENFKDVDLKIISQQNTGPSLAINNNLKYVKYSHIKLVDGDDIIAPNIGDLMKNEMQKNNLDLLYGDWVWNDDPASYKFSKVFKKSFIEKNAFLKIFRKGWGGSSNLMVKTNTLLEVKGCDPQVFVQDYSIPLRITGHHLKFKKKEPFLMAITKTIVCCGPRFVENRIMSSKAQTLYDMSMATINFINDTKFLPVKYKKEGIRRIINRCKKWERRKFRKKLYRLLLIQNIFKFLFYQINEINVANLVARTFKDENVKKIQFKNNKKLKILIYVGLDLLGDALLKVPFLKLLRTYYPKADIHWMAGKGDSIFKNSLKNFSKKLIDRVSDNMEMGTKFRELFIKRKFDEEYDIVIDTQKRFLTTLILRKVSTKIFISSSTNFFFSDLKPIYRMNNNLSLQLINLVEILGNNSGRKISSDLERVKKFLPIERYFMSIKKKCVAICPGASIKKKCWPLENFIEIAKFIYQKGLQPVFFLGPQEERLYKPLKQKLIYASFPLQEINFKKPSPVNTILLAQNCLIGISNDTGCGHLLASANIPILTLFGPTSAEKFKPFTNAQNRCIESSQYGSKAIGDIPCSKVKEVLKCMLKL